MKISKGKVFVGMSGGVDSSVSAALLKQAGYDVTGVFIKVWHPEWAPCTWKDDRRDAMRVAAVLDIPFLTFDFEEEYKKEVVEYMINEYKTGRTPNPDVMCNKNIKFGAFLNKAKEMGADFVATGHYAQIKDGIMAESVDIDKDQTYFLWTLTKEQLAHTLFPIGHLTKPEVRKLAEKFGLPTFNKKDSQGLCFIGKIDMKDFLKNYLDEKVGNVLNPEGKVIGTHEGAFFYTIGQRHGFTITEKVSDDAPYYVTEKNIENNTLTVSHDKKGTADDISKEIELKEVNLTTPIDNNSKYQARIRYRQPLQNCIIKKTSDSSLDIIFAQSQESVSQGQSVVLYKDGLCIGGGVIK